MPRRIYSLQTPEKNPFHETEALCWSCSKATACDCPFFFLENPQDGLEAVQAKALVLKTENGETFYKVIDCPSYRKGPPPPMDRQALLALTLL